ncbi:hypothetical protein GGF50DRAFT_106068 [Schizophyllum commune]
MAKPAKKTAAAGTRPITAFFQPRPSRDASSSSSATTSAASISKAAPRLRSAMNVPKDSAPTISTSNLCASSSVLSPTLSSPTVGRRRSSSISDAPNMSTPRRSTRIQTLAATQSPSCSSPPPSRGKPRSKTLKRKQDDVDPENESVVIIHKAPRKTAPSTSASTSRSGPFLAKENIAEQGEVKVNKKPRLSDPEPPRTPAQLAIPSSQSDELNTSAKRLQWQRPVDPDGDITMSTVEESTVSSPLTGPADSLYARSSSPLTSVTTPSSDVADTNRCEDVNALADAVAARVKARLDAVPSSPESRLSDLPDIMDSDDEFDLLPAVPVAKPAAPLPAPRQPSPEHARPQRTRKQATRLPQTVVAQAGPSKPRATKASNPIDFLLKEKARADKNSRGSEALLRAERIANRQNLMDELDEDEDEDDWRADAKAGSKHHQWRMSSPVSVDPDEDLEAAEVVEAVDVVQRMQVFDEKTGQAIKDIVQQDHSKTDVEANRVAGIPLWREDPKEKAMEVDFVWPTVAGVQDDLPLLKSIADAIRNEDPHMLALLLGTGFLTTLDLSSSGSIVSALCTLALDTRSGVSSPAVRALLDIWASPNCKASVGISLDGAVSALFRLNANPTVLEAAGFAKEGVVPVPTDVELRAETLSVVLDLLVASTKARLVPEGDVGNWLMIVILLGMAREPSCHMDGRIVLAIDALLMTLGPSEVEMPLETAICNRLLPFAFELTPVNKAMLASLLAAGSVRARRMASAVAFALLNDRQSVENTRLPSGWAVLRLLAPLDDAPAELAQRFEVSKDTNTNYEDLAGHVQLLAIVLLDARAFALQEVMKYGPRLQKKTDKKDQEEPTPLMLVQEQAQRLHEAIPDTRAAHLDRTRAKLALKQLWSRIYYQREAVVRAHIAEHSNVKNLLMKQGIKPRAKGAAVKFAPK